jgi:hypothetical protein
MKEHIFVDFPPDCGIFLLRGRDTRCSPGKFFSLECKSSTGYKLRHWPPGTNTVRAVFFVLNPPPNFITPDFN